MIRAVEQEAVGSVGVNVTIVAAFVLVTLVIVYRASYSNRTVSEILAAGRTLNDAQNGMAIAGDYGDRRRLPGIRRRMGSGASAAPNTRGIARSAEQ